jgi:hypothetical protein
MNVWFFLIGVFLVLLGGSVIQIGMHELVHQKNFMAEGIDSTISVKGFTVWTIPEQTNPSEEVLNRLKIENSFNESVSYNVIPAILTICGVIILCTLYLGSKHE